MDKERIFGGNPVGVIVRLAVLSIVVGIVLSALGIDPRDIPRHLVLLGRRIYDLGFGAFESVFGYLILGAMVVVPVWLVARLLGVFRQRDDGRR
ncbi:MAG: DUF6460 domain-containing protein [Hyphomicrobiaceae bacterium]